MLPTGGDHRRIEWGTAFLAGQAGRVQAIIGDIDACRDAFAREGRLTAEALRPPPRKVDYTSDAVAALLARLDVEGNGTAEVTLLVAYDDEWSVEHMHRRLRPWWRRHEGAAPLPMLAEALADADAVLARCDAFDRDLEARAASVGGPGYAALLALTWRHAVAADPAPDVPSFISRVRFPYAPA